MFDFATIDEVRLTVGDHTNPSDGLCFMEMVAWFAGEEHSDKPECACPVLGAYAICLNDRMPDGLRDRLLKPLVPMISGTRDSASELPRAEFLAMWAVNRTLPIILRKHGLADHATACENARTLDECKAAADAADYAAYAAYNGAARAATANAAYAAYASAAYNARAAAVSAANAANAEVWPLAVEGLRQAILIGRHDGFGVAELTARREKLHELVMTND